MIKRIFLILLFLANFSAYSKTWVVTNNGFSFSPSNLSINFGDSIRFQLVNGVDCKEVSKSTWDQDESYHLSGGFRTSVGGGLILPSHLSIGDHYFVSTVHSYLGMKGRISVIPTSTSLNRSQSNQFFTINPTFATENITINISNFSSHLNFTISDVIGNHVMSGKLVSESTNIPINKLNAGVYLVKVMINNQLITKKIIKN